jgi:hypothetical protein
VTLHVITWVWGNKYGPEYVARLAAGVHRHLHRQFRFMVVHPYPEDEHLTKIPGCLARLRTFDPEWQKGNRIKEGDRIVCLDLDLIITGTLDPLFDRPEPFLILQGANSTNPCPYNGSVWSVVAGYRPDVWSEFTFEKAAAVPWYAYPDDQSYFAAVLPDAAGWKAGTNGVYAFGKPGWPKGTDLPKDARLVAFPGRRDPRDFVHLPWVKQHWS